jgi:hypothetical protein
MSGEHTRAAVFSQPDWLRQVPTDERLPDGNPLFTGCGTSFHAAQTGGDAVQALVDHRFNRSSYDAEKVIAEFSQRLHNTVDPHELVAELRQVLDRTLQPSRASIWLREDR